MQKHNRIAKVVMLPTNVQGVSICRYIGSNKLEFKSHKLAYHTNQHLYFLVKEEIKEGDYFIVGKRVVQAIMRDGSLGYDSFDEVAFLWIQDHHMKIVATTDRSLTYKEYLIPGVVGRYFTNKQFPQPSDEFMRYFCDQNGEIDSVYVEFYDAYEELMGDKEFQHETVVVNEDNTIVIKPVKDSWTREEVLALREDAFYKGYDYGNDEIEDNFDRDKFINKF